MSGIIQVPTLGEFHKIVCDALGLWSDEKLESTFYVPATEKERREALQDAFSQVQNIHQGEVSIDDLLKTTGKLAPDDKCISKQLKTIRAYTIQFAKNDFATISEFNEFQEYILQVIAGCYSQSDTAELAQYFYLLALKFYREWVREFVVAPGAVPDAYQYFVNNVLKSIIINLASRHAYGDRDWLQEILQDEWPMRRFVDELLLVSNNSVYKLCQYHAEAKSNKNVEFAHLQGGDVDTASKQVIDRLSRYSKVKWRIYLQTITPLQKETPFESSVAYFNVTALSTLIVHNLNIHLDNNDCESLWDQNFSYPSIDGTFVPSSDFIEYIEECGQDDSELRIHRQIVEAKLAQFHEVLDEYDLVLNQQDKIPSVSEIIFGNGEQFSIEEWSISESVKPNWVTDWIKARKLMKNGELLQAATHYLDAAMGAKYSAGPLWMRLFFEMSCVCKCAFSEFGDELFDVHFEPFASQVVQYAKLLGYVPYSGRNPNTLMPNPFTEKESFIFHKTQKLIESGFIEHS